MLIAANKKILKKWKRISGKVERILSGKVYRTRVREKEIMIEEEEGKKIIGRKLKIRWVPGACSLPYSLV